MKIGQLPDGHVATGSQSGKTGSAPQAQVAVEKTTAAGGVPVTISGLTRTLEQSGQASGADIDMDKVKAVRAALEQGTYTVNPEAIVDKLLANAQEMLNRSRH
jgi:negative regulator of flagellin synthesis FlgM